MAREAIDTPQPVDFEQYQLPEPAPDSGIPIIASPSGAVLENGDFASPNFVSGVSGWKLDSQGNFEGVSGTFSGTVSVSSLNIPNSTTANSYHVDSSGNTWWGANVATGYTGANAYILNTGAAVFKNISVGGTTLQYVITNSGIFSFGDSSDGTATCDGSTAVTGMTRSGSAYTMTRDTYFSSLTIDAGVTLDPGGYRLFVSSTLTINGQIKRNGNNGSIGGDGGLDGGSGPGGGGSGGAALADGYLKGSVAGAAGRAAAAFFGGAPTGFNGTSTTNSLGTAGSAGGGGGASTQGNNGSATTGGAATASNVKLTVGVQLATLFDVILVDGTPTGYKPGQTIRFDNSGGAGGGNGGSAGAGGGAPDGGGGGGAGSGGGIIAIYARIIIIGAAGSITTTGGNGAAGGVGSVGTNTGGGGGGGGGGGNGGIIILIYNTLTNSGSVTCTAGTGGSGGAGGGGPASGSPGSAGTNGSAGTIYQFQLSL